MTEKKTECVCPLAGFCNRHGIKKNEHFHNLCQNHQGYFNMWEECRGPGQQFTDCKEVKTEEEISESRENKKTQIFCKFCNNQGCDGRCRNQQVKPSKVQMLKNLTSSVKEHAKTGFTNVSEEEQNKRLEICKGCEFYIPEEDRCGKCGCYLKSKSTWKSSKCPINKW